MTYTVFVMEYYNKIIKEQKANILDLQQQLQNAADELNKYKMESTSVPQLIQSSSDDISQEEIQSRMEMKKSFDKLCGYMDELIGQEFVQGILMQIPGYNIDSYRKHYESDQMNKPKHSAFAIKEGHYESGQMNKPKHSAFAIKEGILAIDNVDVILKVINRDPFGLIGVYMGKWVIIHHNNILTYESIQKMRKSYEKMCTMLDNEKSLNDIVIKYIGGDFEKQCTDTYQKKFSIFATEQKVMSFDNIDKIMDAMEDCRYYDVHVTTKFHFLIHRHQININEWKIGIRNKNIF